VTGYRLAVDYGTSFTAAAVADGSPPEVLEFSSARHSRYLPSLVLVDQRGEVHVGTRAVAKRGAVPADHVCAAPKRQLGPEPLILGSVSLAAADVVAATLSKVAEEARHQHNGEIPDEVVMTHPALWSGAQCQVLRDAAVRAGLASHPSTIRLLPEPVAAVSFYVAAGSGPQVAVGESVAVYDLGGGTFDCAVLTRNSNGWELAGPPGGDERLGGEDFDESLLEWVADRMMAEDADAWGAFEDDDSPRGRSDWIALLELIRSAKEELSSEESTEVGLPPGPLPLDSLLVTRAEFTVLIAQALDRSMQAFARCLDAAGVSASGLSAVYLTGGSSRIPAIKGELHRRFGIEPTTYKDPKAITALGALSYDERPKARADAHLKHAEITSAHDLRAALQLAGSVAGGSTSIFDNVGLLIDETVMIAGGNETRVAAVELAGHGDKCIVLFAAHEIVAWLDRQPAESTVHVSIGSNEARFQCGRGDAVSIPVLIAPDEPPWPTAVGGKPTLALADIPVQALTTLLSDVRQRGDDRLPLALSASSVIVDGHPLAVRPIVDEPVSELLPRLPVVAILEYVQAVSAGLPGEMAVATTATDCLFLFERNGRSMTATFRRPSALMDAWDASTRDGSVGGKTTIRVTPKPTLGGVGKLGVGFRLRVDGTEISTDKWNPAVVEVAPGRHTIDCFCTQPGWRAYSKAQLVVNVVAGQQLDVLYKQAPTTLQGGKLMLL
jgi:hypothetical protein